MPADGNETADVFRAANISPLGLPAVLLQLTDHRLVQDGGPALITVMLSRTGPCGCNRCSSVFRDTAIRDSDYTLSPSSITLPAGGKHGRLDHADGR